MSLREPSVASERDPPLETKRIGRPRDLHGLGRSERPAVTIDREWNGQAARKAMLEVFEALGDEHPLTEEFRRRLQMVLF